jgi:hypothetical protein
VLLRAGKRVEAQKMLIESDHLNEFLWLCGAIPEFDNICYFEVIEQGKHIGSDLDREKNLNLIQ